jgi:hypothetical protein
MVFRALGDKYSQAYTLNNIGVTGFAPKVRFEPKVGKLNQKS